MRRTIGLGLCLLLAVSTVAEAGPKTPLERYQQLTAKRTCPGFDQIDLAKLSPDAWSNQPSSPDFHRDLRAKTGSAPPPETGVRLLVGWSGGHHEIVSGSLAVTRGADGVWRAEGVDTFRSMVPAPPPPPGSPPSPPGTTLGENPTQITHKAWTLTPDDSAKLDAMIADPCLEAEPRTIILYGGIEMIGGGRSSCVGGAVTTLDIFDRDRRLTSRQHCGSWGVAGRIIGLVFDSRAHAAP